MPNSIAALFACLALAAPAAAQTLDGADDPAFRSALTTLLAADDPAAVATLRDLAEDGNAAALVTLPFALQWVPPKGNLKEKNAQRQVGGVNALNAAKAAHPATALWDSGQAGDATALPDRAAGLLALAEPEKAATLLYDWLNQTGGAGDLPPLVLHDDIPAMIGAYALVDRLRHVVFFNGSVPAEAARLQTEMRNDRVAAWIAYVQLLEGDPEIFETMGGPLAGTGLSAADSADRIENARAVRSVWRAFIVGETPTPAATAARAREVLAGRIDLLPITRLCQARCPGSIASCETAALAYPGLPHPAHTGSQPFADALDPLAFAASDRGLFAVIRLRQGLSAAADRATAESLDACYAALLAHRDTLDFGP